MTDSTIDLDDPIDLNKLETALEKFDTNTLGQSGLYYWEQAIISEAARAYLQQQRQTESNT